jgi:hypothetical protein
VQGEGGAQRPLHLAHATAARASLPWPPTSLNRSSPQLAHFARHLAGANFTLSLFDKLWHPDVTQEEALEMMEKGIEEVKKRLVVAPAHYIIKVVDKDGIRTVKLV